MEQLEDLQVRQTSAGDRDGVVLFTSRRGGRHVAVRLDARHAAIGNPRAVEPEPPGRGVRIVTGADAAPPDEAAGPALDDDYRFFADLLAGAGVEVAAVVLDVASGAEPQATVHVRRGTAEAAVPAAVGQALALAAAANAPIRATPATVAAGGLAEGGRPPPEPADVARAVEAAGATYRLGQALAAAARGRAGSFAVRLVPAEGRLAGQVGVVAPEGHVVDTIPGLALGFAHVGDATAPVSAGRIEISGVGSFAVTVRPGAAETLLELAPLPAADR